MKLYFAPMEGITNWVYRRAHHKYFGGIEKYFTPFLAPGPAQGMSVKELRDVLPEYNEGIPLVPQLLTNRAEDFLDAARKLSEYGYREINLNLGCPSGTVTAKKKGAGFLAFPDELDRFFDRVFLAPQVRDRTILVSVKTRIGKDEREEWPELLRIYNRYPLSELIIHPRLRTDFYKNTPDWDAFRLAVSESKNPLVYNGDLFQEEAVSAFQKEFPNTETVMIGRGLVSTPSLARRLSAKAFPDEKRTLYAFHEELLSQYLEIMSGEKNVLFKMKEIWSYMIAGFPDRKKQEKKIKKAARLCDYRAAVEELFEGE